MPPITDTIAPDEREKLGRILARYQRSYNYCRPYFERTKDFILAYKFFRDPKSHAYKYNPSTPLAFTIIENITSTIVNSFFERDDIARVSAVPQFAPIMQARMIDHSKLAMQLERAVNTYLKDPELEFLLEFMDVMKNCAIFGNSYSTVLPSFDTDNPMQPIYRGPRTDCRDFWDVIPDPRAFRLSKARWVFLREIIPYDDLKEREVTDGYFNVDNVKNSTFIRDDIREEMQSKFGKLPTRETGFDKDNNMVLLLHHFEKGHITTIAANQTIVRDTTKPKVITLPDGTEVQAVIPPYPYDPFDDVRMWNVPKEFFGIGAAEVVISFQNDINLFRSMRLENIELALKAPWLANPLFDLDIDNILFAPDNIILTNDIERGIKKLEVPPITQGSYQEEALMKYDAQDASGSTEFNRGNTPSRQETATTVVQLQRAGLQRLQTVLKVVGVQWFRSIIKKTIIQMRTYMSQPEYEMLIGEPDAGLFALSPKEIARLFHFMPSATSVQQVREIEQSNFIQAFQALGQAADVINRRELAKKFFELFFPNENPERFLAQQLSPMEIMQMQGGMPQGQLPPGQSPEGEQPTPRVPGQPTVNPKDIMRLALGR